MLSQSPMYSPMSKDETKESLTFIVPNVVSTVGFIGAINGLIYLYMNEKLAAQLAANMIGMTESEIMEAGDEVINDAIGEITNMTVGTFKNQLSDKGFPCKLTIPSIMRGSNIQVDSISRANRRTYRFIVGEHVLIADLFMQPLSE